MSFGIILCELVRIYQRLREKGSSSTPKILGVRFDVLKAGKIKVVFWITAVALSLVSTYFTQTSGLDAPIFYMLKIFKYRENYISNFLIFHLMDIYIYIIIFQNLVYMNT